MSIVNGQIKKRKKRAPTDSTKKDYVSNKLFYEAMVEYNKLSGVENPDEDVLYAKDKVYNVIGQYFIVISNNLAKKSNFNNYTYIDDMILDGIENCVRYMGNFDETKSTNPFCYFSTIVYNTFARKIMKENRQLYTKYKLLNKYIDTMSVDENMEVNSYLQITGDEFIVKHEEGLAKKAEKKKAKEIENEARKIEENKINVDK